MRYIEEEGIQQTGWRWISIDVKDLAVVIGLKTALSEMKNCC